MTVTKFKMEIVAKQGVNEIARIWGLEKDTQHVTVGDLTEVIELEQKLEKLTGLRWHIQFHQI